MNDYSQFKHYIRPLASLGESNKTDSPKPPMTSFSQWRQYDMIELLEFLSDWIRNGNNTVEVLQKSISDNLPCSIATLMLNSIRPIQNIIESEKSKEGNKSKADELPSIATLASQCGLGGIFTKDIESIWRPSKAVKPDIAPIIPEEQTKSITVPNNVNQSQEPEQDNKPLHESIIIKVNSIPNGKQWKIGGQLIAEYRYIPGIGHIGNFHAGNFKFQTRGYNEASMALNQCRSFAEGVLKLLKTIPR